jgi:hypothetical protein
LVPYYLAKAEIPCTYIWCERRRGGRNKEAYRFRLICWGMPHVPKNTGDGPIKWLFLAKKKTMGVLHYLIEA